MNNTNELPETITDDPRIGTKVLVLCDGEKGTIESIYRFDDGCELFNVECTNTWGYPVLFAEEFEVIA